MKQMTLPATVAKIPDPQRAPNPAPTQPQAHAAGWWAWPLRLLVPTFLGAGLLWLCYFPMAWGWLAWVAVVPLLTLLRSRAWALFIYPCAFLTGLVFYAAVLRWMPVADDRMYATWAALSIYCSLYFSVTLFLVRWLERRTPLPLVVTLPAVWAGLEYLRSFLLTGFAWYYLGHTQHIFLPIIQVCDLGGVYVVSFLIAAVNAWVFEVLFAQEWFRKLLGQQESTKRPGWGRLAVHAIALAVLVSTVLFYGFLRLQENNFQPGPRVALIQSNVDQRLRNTKLTKDDPNAPVVYKDILLHLTSLNALATDPPLRADLVVWPETSHPGTWLQTSMNIPTHKIPVEWAKWQMEYTKDVQEFVTARKKAVLLGINTEVLTEVEEQEIAPGQVVNVIKKRDRFNSALLVHSNGAIAQRYDKLHRVPFGEYVPFREWTPFMEQFAPYDFDYSIKAGEKLTRLGLGKYTFGVLICYEDTDPFLARQYGAKHEDGRAVDFLVNMSNDGWFDGSSEHEEHLALCRFRAIETRRAVARSVNMGISAVIDSNGRVLKPLEYKVKHPTTGMDMGAWPVPDLGNQVTDLPIEEWSAKKKVPGVLVATIPIDHRTSLYAMWGDWFPITCWSLLGLVFVWSFAFRRKIQINHG